MEKAQKRNNIEELQYGILAYLAVSSAACMAGNNIEELQYVQPGSKVVVVWESVQKQHRRTTSCFCSVVLVLVGENGVSRNNIEELQVD